MTIQVGDKIPSVTLHHMTDKGPAEITTDELFNNKKVVLFALPGAFTPTCSQAHVPGYLMKSDELFAKGVDQIVCLSVNDAFVMGAWGVDQNVEDKILMLADGSAVFTRAVGLELDAVARGMGIRSQRYAMIVNNGIVELLNVEAAGEFKISDAQTILDSL
jgi:glutaredoxin/glutathione-dependent peroxiredoxin